MTVLDFLEKLARFAHERFGDEMVRSRENFFRDLGIIHETDELYEETMKAWLDWFLFERPVDEKGLTPVRLFIDQAAEALNPEEGAVFAGFAFSGRRSLFHIRKVLPDSIECKDLFTGKKQKIREDVPEGFIKGEIFEARILPFEDDWRFGDLLRFHPPRANRLILKAAKPIKNSGDAAAKALLAKLASCKVKHFRHPRVDAVQFYSELLK